jgi:CHASE2 domain-containing sensor protein
MKHKFYYLAFAVVVAIVLSASYSYGLFAGVERFFQDRLFSDKPINQDIAIIAIDDASIGEVGQWPWPRSAKTTSIPRALTPSGSR